MKQKKQIQPNFFELQLAGTLADIHGAEKMLVFLRAFLSKNELAQLGTRLAIHAELEAGQSYEQIQKKLGVSSATISLASQQQKNSAMKMALQLLALDSWAREKAEKIRRYLPFL
ncbi:MAG: hypothetical protein GW946_01705 [Candidatus Pacebacteria bacterium]|nr:hypothetical protein [Candidatus Paceibacterota bacterium]PIR60465.1 MAG: hypothetical protein COU67_01680 [Candidatus Pacebacteria bacterium CG10_big_fil_rev_8_21_14_0_10_44_54]